MIFFLIGILIAYFLVVVKVQPYISKVLAGNCVNCSKGEKYKISYDGPLRVPGWGHEASATWAALAWPVALPLVTNLKRKPHVKMGMRKIDRYWEEREEEEMRELTESYERKAGLL